MDLGKNASYEDYAALNESLYPRTPEKIAEYWLKKYKESTDEGTSLLYEDDNVKIIAKNRPAYCSGWTEGDEDAPGTNKLVLEVQVSIKNPSVHYDDKDYLPYDEIEDGKYYLAAILNQSYSFVQTYYDAGSYWDPPESEGFYEPSGDIYIEDYQGPELFKNLEDAINGLNAIDSPKKYLWDQKGVVLAHDESFFAYIDKIDALINDLADYCTEAPVSDPDGVSDSYYRKQQDLEARAEESYGKY